jgi:hypothetical protein
MTWFSCCSTTAAEVPVIIAKAEEVVADMKAAGVKAEEVVADVKAAEVKAEELVAAIETLVENKVPKSE